MNLYRLIFSLVVFALLIEPPAAGAHLQTDSRQNFTLEDLFASPRFIGSTFYGGRWADEGPIIYYVDTDRVSNATHIMSFNLETDTRSRVVDGSHLVAPDVNRLIEIEDYTYNSDRTRMLIYTDSERVWRLNTKGYYYIYDLEEGSLTPLSRREEGFQMFAKFSPDGRHIGFVRNRNIFVVNVETMEERQLTFDGSENAIINGTFDWVYEEEFYLRDGWSWSPDGARIAFFKLDESQTRQFTMVDVRPLYPEFFEWKYPKAGEKNSEIRIGIIDLGSGEQRFFDTGTWNDAESGYEYLSGMGWTPEISGRSHVWMYRMNRDQNHLQLLYGDPETAGLRIVLDETEPTWISIDETKLTFLEDGRHFTWVSEVDGFNHIYLYTNDGERARQVTSGQWDVTDVHGIDEQNGFIYFTATIESPLERHLYRVPLNPSRRELRRGVAPVKISREAGWHEINLSSDRKYYVDTHSRIDRPPVTSLHKSDGSLINVLVSNEELIADLQNHATAPIRFFTVPAADGTPLAAQFVLPADFDSTRAYPMLLYQYAGPGSQVVQNAWGGQRYLWHQMLANELDLVVAYVDNRGTGARGKDFKSQTYLQLGIVESDDLIAAARHLGAKSYIDEERIGIWGWSYGGYTTLLAMLRGDGPETFRMGISVAPVTDWRFYDTIYTERYMSTPQRNPHGYNATSAVRYADRLRDDRQRLIIIHGDYDDNVHFQNAVNMTYALQAANKQFDFMVYPGRNHSIFGGLTRLHLHTLMTNYIRKNLVR